MPTAIHATAKATLGGATEKKKREKKKALLTVALNALSLETAECARQVEFHAPRLAGASSGGARTDGAHASAPNVIGMEIERGIVGISTDGGRSFDNINATSVGSGEGWGGPDGPALLSDGENSSIDNGPLYSLIICGGQAPFARATIGMATCCV